jgi:hypothetical protein
MTARIDWNRHCHHPPSFGGILRDHDRCASKHAVQDSHEQFALGSSGAAIDIVAHAAGHGSPSSGRTRSLDLHAYCDSDWGTNPVDRRSVTGYVFMLDRGAAS